jgi:hypothetical protein
VLSDRQLRATCRRSWKRPSVGRREPRRKVDGATVATSFCDIIKLTERERRDGGTASFNDDVCGLAACGVPNMVIDEVPLARWERIVRTLSHSRESISGSVASLRSSRTLEPEAVISIHFDATLHTICNAHSSPKRANESLDPSARLPEGAAAGGWRAGAVNRFCSSMI